MKNLKTLVTRFGVLALCAGLIVQTSRNFSPPAYASYGTGVPSGTILPYAGSAAPDGFVFCYGQAISRTTAANLFVTIGTTYGVGDGATTYNVPDLRGRDIAGKDDMGGAAANRITNAGSSIVGTTLGASGGAEAVTLSAAQSGSPAHSHAITDPGHIHTISDPGHTHGPGVDNFFVNASNGGGNTQFNDGPGFDLTNFAATTASNTTGISINSHSTGITINNSSATAAASAHSVVQPTLILNYIIKL